MINGPTSRLVPGLLSTLLLAAGVAAQPLARPVAGRGAEAKTLLVYAGTRPAYSLTDGLESLKLHLRRVATRLETAAVSNTAPDRIARADYVVVYCPQPFPNLSPDFLRAVAEANEPVLWIGFGADKLAEQTPFKGQFEVSAFAAGQSATRISYRGREWNVTVDPWIPARLHTNPTSEVILSFQEQGDENAMGRPLCWKTAHTTFFMADPVAGGLGFLFEDVLLGFYGVKDVPPQRVFLRIDGYHCRQNHREFRRMVNYLYARGHPFIVAVVPAYRDPATGELLELDSQPEFVESLRYAQQRGGRLIMESYAYASGARGAANGLWWDFELDRPIAGETAAFTRERLLRDARQMLRHGLLPLAWETPSYAATGATYAEVAKIFSTAVERVQLSDATCRASSEAGGLTLDRFGRLIVPENLGYVLDTPVNVDAAIKAQSELLTALRGTVAGCFIHSYQPLEKLTALVETLESLHVPFLDLMDLDNSVELPDGVLLTGAARRTVTLQSATVRWKAFDRAGNPLAEKREPAASSGERTFERMGAGDCELFEFGEVRQ